jgi:glycosyltransferase involved in cell wall biosynthesis
MRGEPGWQREANFVQHAPMMRPQPSGNRLPVRFIPKRIALIAPSRAMLAVNAGSMIYEIGRSGHQAFCFAPELKEPSATEALARLRARVDELPAFRQGFSPIADQRSVMKLASAFRQIKPDIVAGYSPKGALLTALAARMAGVAHVVSMIGELGRGFEEAPDEAALVSRHVQKAMLRIAFRFSDTAVFFNEQNFELLQRLKVIPERLRQFPMNGNGVDLRRFAPAPLPPIDRGIMFLYAAPLDKRLGIVEFCKAARILRSKPGNYQCIVVGPEIQGPNGFPLSALKRYRDVVQYVGPQADPRPAIAHTHVFVLPARGDLVPQALIEAVAMGRPVITSTSRGCRVAVREGANGMIVPSGDAGALASAMARLLLRPDLIPAMSRASRELAESQFDARRINGLLMSALDI